MKCLISVCCLLLSLAGVAQQTKKQAPNVLMIAVDDLNDFIGAMGHPDAITPNIDRLAANGAIFTNAHCQAPLCGPSRASILTGLRPSSTGIYGMIEDNEIRAANKLTKGTTFMHQYFKDAGYHLLGVGKIFHRHFPDGLLDEDGGTSGYGPFPQNRFKWNTKGTDTDWGVFPEKDQEMPDDKAAAWAIEKLSKKYDKPFFMSVGFIRPHVPWYVPQKWFDLYNPQKLQLPPYLPDDRADLPEITKKIDAWPSMPSTEWAIKNNEWRNMVQAYLACISFVDYNIGRVVDALEKSQHKNNTVIVLWSDHGYRLGEKNTFAKVCLWDRATKAPLIFSGTGVPKHKVINEPVELLDIYPTLTDLAGLKHNNANEGHSLVELMQKQNVKWNKPAITTWGRNNTAVKTKDYRFIQYEDGSQELYDVKKDANEWYNLAENPKYKNIIKKLQTFLPTENAPWAEKSFYKANDYFLNKGLEKNKK